VASGIALGALLAAGILLCGCRGDDDPNAYAPPPPPEVVVANPVERDVVSYLTYTGTVEASEVADIRARVQGFLDEVKFVPGQRVKQNDILFVIDKREYEAEVAQAKAVVDASEAKLALAETTLERVIEAFKQGGASDIEVREERAARDEAKAQLDLARAKLDNARLELSYCDVRSPIDGRVGRNLVDAGNLVGRGESTVLAQVVQATPAYITVEVNEADVLAVRRAREADGTAHQLEPGQIAPGKWRPSELALGDERDYSIGGRIDYVEPQMNQQTGTLGVRTVYENTDEMLIPGLFGRVRFAMSSTKSLVVPEAALLSDQQGRFAMVVNANDEIEVRRVEIGPLDGSDRVVTGGLTKDDRVVVLGVLKARPGAKVTPKRQEVAAAGR